MLPPGFLRSDPSPTDLVEPGCWRGLGTRRFPGRPALFLDRDGVVIEDVGFIGRVKDVALTPGAGETIAAFNRAGLPVVIVTNQSGVARGYFDWAAFEAVQAEMARRLAAEGAQVDAAFACAYHEAGEGELALPDHPWRKPNPGMILAAGEALGVDLRRSVIVGDRAGDLEAGRAAGLAAGLQVFTGHGAEPAQQAAAAALATNRFAVRQAAGIAAALDFLPALVEA